MAKGLTTAKKIMNTTGVHRVRPRNHLVRQSLRSRRRAAWDKNGWCLGRQ
jgi:hypothetical protein